MYRRKTAGAHLTRKLGTSGGAWSNRDLIEDHAMKLTGIADRTSLLFELKDQTILLKSTVSKSSNIARTISTVSMKPLKEFISPDEGI